MKSEGSAVARCGLKQNAAPVAPGNQHDPDHCYRQQVEGGQRGAVGVLCTTDAGFGLLFIRFAEQTASNGSSSPRLDPDICEHDGGGGGAFACTITP